MIKKVVKRTYDDVYSSFPEGVMRQISNALFEDVIKQIDMIFLSECTLLGRKELMVQMKVEYDRVQDKKLLNAKRSHKGHFRIAPSL